MYSKLVKHLIFPTAQLLRGAKSLRFIREWERTQWLPAEDLRRLQLDKLKKMLRHAAENVPYYRRTFREAGFDPEEVASLEDLVRLPVIGKDELREHTGDFLAENHPEGITTAKTGGSTGEPLAFPVGKSLAAGSMANMVRCRRWWGIEPGDASVNFWGHSRYLAGRPLDRIKKLASAAKGRLLNRTVCSAYDMSDQAMRGYWRRALSFRPAFLIGYATSLYTFADFVLRERLDGSRLPLKAVISTAEVLYDWQRETVEEAFSAPVVNEYGMCEAGIVAYQCPEGSMHVMDERCIVEILPAEGSSATGDIVVTELENFAAPLIRYNTKDMASPIDEPCPCGRGLSRISAVEGRAYDIIYASDGSPVAGALLTHVMKSLPAVGRYQIVQRGLRELEISYTLRRGAREARAGFSADREGQVLSPRRGAEEAGAGAAGAPVSEGRESATPGEARAHRQAPAGRPESLTPAEPSVSEGRAGRAGQGEGPGTAGLSDEDRGFVERTLKKHLGPGVEITLRRVEEIEKERSGKHRWLKSEVTPDEARAAKGGAR